MNYPAASCEVSNTMNMLIEQFDLITMYYLILLSLAFYIICYGSFVAIAANGVNVISTCPEFSTPKYFLSFRVFQEYFSRRNTLYRLHNFFRPQYGHTLHQKMHMIVINSNFYKMNLVPLSYPNTYIVQTFRYCFCKYFSPLFCRAYNVV